uniref:Uncharacterized protein n=1 Tax=Candidatus Kentrum sp. LFY TaxID=2126342 RepID=A0A450U7I2_9GAMM|nr:MAG: hypothetical protein BECKLFY1418A_GA0070994_100230 [Candidatus Kentron sp. LFY]
MRCCYRRRVGWRICDFGDFAVILWGDMTARNHEITWPFGKAIFWGHFGALVYIADSNKMERKMSDSFLLFEGVRLLCGFFI